MKILRKADMLEKEQVSAAINYIYEPRWFAHLNHSIQLRWEMFASAYFVL